MAARRGRGLAERRRTGTTLDELLLRLQGLVRVRDLLRERGASEAELEEHSAEIGRLHWRLARLTKDGLDPQDLAA